MTHNIKIDGKNLSRYEETPNNQKPDFVKKVIKNFNK